MQLAARVESPDIKSQLPIKTFSCNLSLINDDDILIDYLLQGNTQVTSIDNVCSFEGIRLKQSGIYALKITFTLGKLEIIKTLEPFYISEKVESARLISSKNSFSIGSIYNSLDIEEINENLLRRFLVSTFQDANASIWIQSISTYFNVFIGINLIGSDGKPYTDATVFEVSDNDASITVSSVSSTTIEGGSGTIGVFFNSSGDKDITITIPSMSYTISNPLSITVVDSLLNITMLSAVMFT